MISKESVAVVVKNKPWIYPEQSPYRPHGAYPELSDHLENDGDQTAVHEVFRQLLVNMDMDQAHFGTAEWNPFGELIKPGDRVVIKPNLVLHTHHEGGDYRAVVTQGAVIRCALDYAALALRGDGLITVGDAPVQSGDFRRTVERLGLEEVCADVSKSWEIPVQLKDFRLSSVNVDKNFKMRERMSLDGDPDGYRAVDLQDGSLVSALDDQSDRYRVTNYDPQEMRVHHSRGKHEYLIPRTILDADAVINLPKMKTHRKVCVTAALKNLVGINGHKDWLPHHRYGAVKEGGDEYPTPSIFKKVRTKLIESIDRHPLSATNRLRRVIIRLATFASRVLDSERYFEGSWYGNDTLWRTVLDLNRILLYADGKGMMAEEPLRNCLTIVDGIIAGEGEGPMEPTARSCGLLVGGPSAVAVDAVIATLIGFDYRKIPLILNGFAVNPWPLVHFGPEEVSIHSPEEKLSSLVVGDTCRTYGFLPPSGWQGHV